MKKYVSTMIAGVAALAFAGSASAQTITVRITGSTAFRAITHNAIKNIITPASLSYGYTGTSFGGASQAEFRGILASDGVTPVDIKTAWAGSVGGINHLTENVVRTDWLVGTNLTGGGTASLSGPFESALADVAMADHSQGQTAFTSPTLTAQKVGVIPFAWTKNVGAPAGIANMTAQLAQTFLTSGKVRLSQFTGNEADSTQVLCVGRDADSGTRVVSFAEPGFGVFGLPTQFQVLKNGSAITNIVYYPAQTILGVDYDEGTGGYASGGSSGVQGALNGTGSDSAPTPFGTGCWLVGYLGVGDAAGVNGGANNLTYNGVAYSTNAVSQGTYTFWGYEHLMYKTTLVGAQKTVADNLATQIITVDAASANSLRLSDMKVSRSVAGSVVTR